MKYKFTVTKSKSAAEAIGNILGGLWYFVCKYPKTTIPLLLLLLGLLSFIINNYLGLDTIKVKKAEPIRALVGEPIGTNSGLFVTSLYAQTKSDSIKRDKPKIIINGEFYGYMDTTFLTYKKLDENVLIIYDKNNNYIFEIDAPILGKLRSKDFKKGLKK